MKYENSTEVQDTLRALGIDKEKFWYLCLLIKDYVEGETIDTFINNNPTHREEMQCLIKEIEKLKPRKWGDLYFTEGNGELKIKISKHPLVITDGHTLALIKLAVEEYLERNACNTILLDSSPVDFDSKTTLAFGYRLFLFDKYLSWFLKGFKANKKVQASDSKNKVSTDKKLLISRMLFILGVTDEKDYYEEYDEDVHKNDKLKNTLKNYKNAKIDTDNKYYFW